MSKFSNLLKLIVLLKSKNRMKTKELAEALNVSERMIRKYIADLNEANINVQSIPGPNGGYKLSGNEYLLNLDITSNELYALKLADEVLKENCDVNLYENFSSAKDKIQVVCENKAEYGIDRLNLSQSIEMGEVKKEHAIEVEIMAAIIRKKKIKVIYESNSSGRKERILRPYEIFSKDNRLYLEAFCETRNKVITFKLVRMESVDILEETYEIPMDYEGIPKNNLGIFHDEKFYLELHIKPPFSKSVSEGIYATDQEVIWNEDKSITFKGTMYGKPDIIRWILAMQEYVTIIEPKELKNEVKEKLIKMLNVI